MTQFVPADEHPFLLSALPGPKERGVESRRRMGLLAMRQMTGEGVEPPLLRIFRFSISTPSEKAMAK